MKRTSSGGEPTKIAISVRARVAECEALLHALPDVVDPTFLERIEKFATTVALWGSKINLTARPDDPEEIAFHVIDSLMPVILASDKSSILADRFSKDRKALDLGSGAGFPGLVLASASASNFTLVESRRKRASFLQVAVADLGLTNVTIESKRAEDVGLAGQYDLVTARAFGDAGEFFAFAERALKPGGIAMLYANPSQRVALKGCDFIEYGVARRGERIGRILAVQRKT